MSLTTADLPANMRADFTALPAQPAPKPPTPAPSGDARTMIGGRRVAEPA